MNAIEIVARVQAKHGEAVIYLGGDASVTTKQPFRCQLGHEWLATPVSVYWNGNGCRTCGYARTSITKLIGAEEIRYRVKERHGDSVTYLGGEAGVTTKQPFACSLGHRWEAQPNNVFMAGSGCPHCWRERRKLSPSRKTDSTYRNEVRAIHGDRYWPVEPYQTALTLTLHRCHKGHENRVKPNWVLGGNGCWECSYKLRGEANLRTEQNRFEFKDYVLGDRRLRIQGYEPFALDELLREATPGEIRVGRDVPVVRYNFGGKTRVHRADLFIPSSRLIEVKSKWTFGYRHEPWFHQLVAKRHGALAAGFSYEVRLYRSDGSRLEIPDNWFDLTYSEILESFLA